MRPTSCLFLISLLAVAGCDSPTAVPPAEPNFSEADDDDDDEDDHDVVHWVKGRGSIDLSSAGVGPAQFTVSARVSEDDGASGRFWQRRVNNNGLTVEFTGKVTCLAIDHENHRAWVGGIILKNRSTDPAARVDTLHLRGMDIWFRVVDYSEGSTDPRDRSTVFGFRGSAGIVTSAEYCAVKPWPNTPVPDARTFPVTVGDIKVK